MEADYEVRGRGRDGPLPETFNSICTTRRSHLAGHARDIIVRDGRTPFGRVRRLNDVLLPGATRD